MELLGTVTLLKVMVFRYMQPTQLPNRVLQNFGPGKLTMLSSAAEF